MNSIDEKKETDNILIVDDTVENLQLLASILKEAGYKVRPASNGKLALQAIESLKPDLILLDIKMPGMDGYEVCRILKSNPETKNIPVLFISALSDVNDKIRAFQVGGIDYINKPFQFEEVKARVSTHLQLKAYQDEMETKVSKGVERVELLTQEVIETQREIIFTMGEICETRSHETGMHIRRVAEYCYLLAHLAGSEEAWQIKQASPMHDIGKVAIPDSILHKPGKLTADEWIVMKSHSELGHKMLSVSHRPLLKMAATIAYEHHEKWDGTGYPQGLKGEGISFSGRVAALADVFDALGNDRCYKEAWPLDQVLALIKDQRGKHFDPQLVDLLFANLDAFIKISERYKETIVAD